MKIGYYFECSKKSGGVYQYALNLLSALRENTEHSFTVFNISPDFPVSDFNLPNWKIINIVPQTGKQINGSNANEPFISSKKPSLRRKFNLFVLSILRFFHLYTLEIYLTTINSKKRARAFLGHDIDLMFFHGPSELSFLTDIPSIAPIHDLNHRLHSTFKAVYGVKQWKQREYLFKNVVKEVYKIIADSKVSREDIVSAYNVKQSKIQILPHLAPTYMNTDVSDADKRVVVKKYNLPEKFLFYPAQYWPHKNHQRLIRAIKILKDKGIFVPLALAGGKGSIMGEYEKVEKLIRNLGLKDQIHILGYVHDKYMSALYKLSTALILPYFSEPSNIPMVEAWLMDTPVMCADERGCRDQADGSAIMFNPYEPDSMARKIEELWNNKELQNKLVARGRERLASWTREDYDRTIKKIIDEIEKSRN